MHNKNQWRTVSVALSGMLCLLAGLVATGHWSAAAASYPAFAGGIGFCVGAVAAKAAKEHTELARVPSAGEPPK